MVLRDGLGVWSFHATVDLKRALVFVVAFGCVSHGLFVRSVEGNHFAVVFPWQRKL